jgi:hypothetical protein
MWHEGGMVGKPEVKTRLERPRWRWVDDIKMDLRDKMEWYAAQDKERWRAFGNMVMNFLIL